ncbi:MAG: alpha/beta hydrolase [Phenylobacterium sp.]
MLRTFAAFAAAMLLASPAAAQPDPNRLFADSKVVVRDRFSDEVVGKGPDLVFIPGLASSRVTWKATAERLRGKYRLHLIQVAGFAGEPARANATGEVVIPTAEAIDAYLVEQKLSPAVVIGHSLGGTMSLYLAQKHPEHLRKVLIVDALPFYAVAMMGPQASVEKVAPMAAKIRDAKWDGDSAAYGKSMEPQIARMVTAPADRAMVVNWSVQSDHGVVMRALYDDLTLDLRPGLAAMTTPIVLLYPDNVPAGAPQGVMDKMYPPIFAPAATIKAQRIDKSLHFIMLDQPQAFAAALDAFLTQP